MACLAAGEPFHHSKVDCSKRTMEIASRYRVRMQNKWGRPLCYSCLAPVNLCHKWLDPETGRVLQGPTRTPCQNRYAILDTWAVIWECMPTARKTWVQHIQATKGGGWNPDHDQDFRSYFSEVSHYGKDHAAGQICLDVNWFTQTYMLGEDEKYKELLEIV